MTFLTSKNSYRESPIKAQPLGPPAAVQCFPSYQPKPSYSEMECVSSCRSALGEYKWMLALQSVRDPQLHHAAPERSCPHLEGKFLGVQPPRPDLLSGFELLARLLYTPFR